MSMGLACLDLGIQYVALEHVLQIFRAAKRRLLTSVQDQALKRRKLERCSRGRIKETDSETGKEGRFCGIGEKHCRFPGLEPSFSCKACRVGMHDLCDWAKVVKNISVESREMVAVCSEKCFALEK